MKKLLHVTQAFGGGVFTFLTELCNGLCADFDITVAYSKRTETPDNPCDYFDSRIKLVETRYGKRKFDVLNDALYIFELRKMINELKPDIVHLHSSKSGFAGRLAACGTNTGSVLYTAHGYSFLRKDECALKTKLYYALEKLASATDSTTVAVGRSEFVLAKRLSDKAEVVCNGVNLRYVRAFMQNAPALSRPLIAAMGRLEACKNPSLFNEIAGMFPSLPFVWIGGGADIGKLTSSNIRVTGWRERGEALALLAGADIFLMPSLWEGMPITLLEAMGMGRICIAADIPGIREVIRHGENGFLASSAREYADIIQGLAGGAYNAENISDEAVKTIKTAYEAEGMCRGYAAIYEMHDKERICVVDKRNCAGI